MKKQTEKDLNSLCEYIFEHEFEDYCERLQECLPEKEAEKVEGYIRNGNVPEL